MKMRIRKFFSSCRRCGFSLVEVNMAIFVMAMGILSIAVLYPLGLRENAQGYADLKQASFADFLLNQAVAAAQMTNVKWSAWEQVPMVYLNGQVDDDLGSSDALPDFIRDLLVLEDGKNFSEKDSEFRIGCIRPYGYSGKRMVILVQSTEQKNLSEYQMYSNNPIYYAEAYFRGDPRR